MSETIVERVGLREATAILGLSTSTIYRWVKKGWIHPIRLPNGFLRFDRAELEALRDGKPVPVADGPAYAPDHRFKGNRNG